MKKATLIVIGLLTGVLAIFVYLFFSMGVGATDSDKTGNLEKLYKELQKEREALDENWKALEREKQNLRVLKSEIDQKLAEVLRKEDELKKTEALFLEKTEARALDKKLVESYESMDAEQAAILVRNLFQEDRERTLQLLRKLDSKKAGKIMDNLVQLDAQLAAQIAKEVINYYKPARQQ